MKLKDLFEKDATKKGSYAGVRFDKETNRALHKYMKENKIPNAIRPDKLHTTVLYSRKYLPNYKPAGKIEHIYHFFGLLPPQCQLLNTYNGHFFPIFELAGLTN